MEDTVYPLDGKKGYFLGEVDSVTLTPHKRPRLLNSLPKLKHALSFCAL